MQPTTSSQAIIFINLVNEAIKLVDIKDRVNALIAIAKLSKSDTVTEKTMSQFKLICYKTRIGNNTTWTIQTAHNISLN